MAKPWYSYKGGTPIRDTEHVRVLPHQALNTNIGAEAFQKHKRERHRQWDSKAREAVGGVKGGTLGNGGGSCTPAKAPLGAPPPRL